jgi:hypothetical protein
MVGSRIGGHDAKVVADAREGLLYEPVRPGLADAEEVGDLFDRELFDEA